MLKRNKYFFGGSTMNGFALDCVFSSFSFPPFELTDYMLFFFYILFSYKKSNTCTAAWPSLHIKQLQELQKRMKSQY